MSAHPSSIISGTRANVNSQNMQSNQAFEPVQQIEDVSRQPSERERANNRQAVAAEEYHAVEEHHGINLASIGEENNEMNTYENMSNGADGGELANIGNEQVDDSQDNIRDEDGGQRSPSQPADDNISEDEFDECEGSQATASNISVSQSDNINLANDDQVASSTQNMGQRVIDRQERRAQYGGHPRGIYSRAYNQNTVPVPSSGGSGGASNQNASTNGPAANNRPYGGGALGPNQLRPSYMHTASSYMGSSGNVMTTTNYPSRANANGMVTSPNAGLGSRQAHGGHRQGNMLMGAGSTGTSGINQDGGTNSQSSASRASSSQQNVGPPHMNQINQGQQNQTNY